MPARDTDYSRTASGRTAVVVPAAGRGERLGPGAPKALRELAGLPILVHATRSLTASALVDLVVVAAPVDQVAAVRDLLLPHLPADRLCVVAGGATRQQSVWQALCALPEDVDVVLVHDAARPLVPPSVVDAVARAVREGREAVIPVLPLADTVKRVGEDGRVAETVPRAPLRAVQTPQGFARGALVRAHEAAAERGLDATDDAGLIEALGGEVWTVPGSEEAFKVTRPIDLVLAEAVWRARHGG